MKPDRYDAWPGGRRRMTGLIQWRGPNMGFSTLAGFLFGCPFVAAGIAIVLIGAKVIAVDPSSVHAPYWVLTVFGVSFAFAGLMVWGMAWKQFAANRRRDEAVRRHPNEPALADYPWHPDGFKASAWAAAAKALGIAMGTSVFLSMFNWWAFVAHGDWMVKGVVIVLDLVGLVLWAQAAQQAGRAFKFGHSQVVFSGFPYRLPDPVLIRWQSGGGISRVRKGTFTLRCVEEWMEHSGSGRNRTRTVAQEEIWSGTWVLEQPRNFSLRESVELRYELPVDAVPTQFSADRPVFWELEVKLDLPGLDFKQTYLVPIYDSKAASFARALLLNSAS